MVRLCDPSIAAEGSIALTTEFVVLAFPEKRCLEARFNREH
jgi:hypothetical protein